MAANRYSAHVAGMMSRWAETVLPIKKRTGRMYGAAIAALKRVAESENIGIDQAAELIRLAIDEYGASDWHRASPEIRFKPFDVFMCPGMLDNKYLIIVLGKRRQAASDDRPPLVRWAEQMAGSIRRLGPGSAAGAIFDHYARGRPMENFYGSYKCYRHLRDRIERIERTGGPPANQFEQHAELVAEFLHDGVVPAGDRKGRMCRLAARLGLLELGWKPLPVKPEPAKPMSAETRKRLDDLNRRRLKPTGTGA